MTLVAAIELRRRLALRNDQTYSVRRSAKRSLHCSPFYVRRER